MKLVENWLICGGNWLISDGEIVEMGLANEIITIAFGLLFLVNKYIEWMQEIRRGIYPNGPALLKLPDGEKIFYGLYYSMTGLHGLHVLAGVIALSVTLDFVRREKITSSDYGKLENVGLYWHLVDVIWIFLLPLLYLAA